MREDSLVRSAAFRTKFELKWLRNPYSKKVRRRDPHEVWEDSLVRSAAPSNEVQPNVPLDRKN